MGLDVASYAPTEMSEFARTTINNKYAHTKPSGHKESWSEIAERQVEFVIKPFFPHLAKTAKRFIEQRKVMPGGRYLNSAGRGWPQINNCYLYRAEDSREGWSELMYKVTASLMTGGGIGVDYSPLRPEHTYIKGMGGYSTGPLALTHMVNEGGRYIMQGGSRRSAIWAGLIWHHPDIFKFINMKDLSLDMREMKKRDFNFPVPMEGTNISVNLDQDFFDAFKDKNWTKTYELGGCRYTATHKLAQDVYWSCIFGMLQTGEPGFSINVGNKSNETLRNACTEAVSEDDGDMCNLLSINMARMESIEEFCEALSIGAAFTLSGTMYSKLPVEKMYTIREKNRRIGIGLMGIHEWLLVRGYRYERNNELDEWLTTYASCLDSESKIHARKLGINNPIANRSIAPNGTIAIGAETTGGIDPLFAVAIRRRYLDGKQYKAQYVINPTADRLIKQGIDPKNIEDAVTLSEDVERRVAFQAYVQQYVDQGISSTINLPHWGSPQNNENKVSSFGNMLIQYLPKLRGITCYPDGSRDGQPLVRVDYEEAVKRVGVEFSDNSANYCKIGECGT